MLKLVTIADCTYGEWVWNPCSVTCGTGTQIGHRNIEQQAKNGGKCDEPLVTNRNCTDDPDHPVCPAPGTKCIVMSHNRTLKLVITVDCTHGDWIWNPCPVTCGTGTQIGHRNIVQEAENGGECDEPLVMTRDCTEDDGHPADCPLPGMKCSILISSVVLSYN